LKIGQLSIRSSVAIGATLLAAGSAYAQSSVTLYGIIDTGVEYVSHANTAGDSVVRMPSITGELPSRWGLRGSENLGGGYSTEFTLENGFNVHAGDIGQGGRLFGRQAWVGIKSPYGLLSFGRQYTMTFWAMSDADVLGPNIYGMASFDAYLANARSDNTIAYRGTFHGVTLGATWSFGRDAAGTGNSPGQGTCAGSVPGQMTECRQWSAMLKYDASWFGLAAAYDEQRGGTNAAANFYNGIVPFPLTSSVDKDARTQFNGYMVLGTVKVGAGYVGRNVTTEGAGPDVRYNMYFVGGSWQAMPAFSIDGEAIRIVNSEQNARASTAILRANYLLSKSTLIYLQGAYLANSAHAAYSISAGGGGTTPARGANQTAVMAGIQHRF
jgi:predicted porin